MYDIIDFHTHPFLEQRQNICMYRQIFSITTEEFRNYMESIGISAVCGSVIDVTKYDNPADVWRKVKNNNNAAYKLRELYGEFYIPGIHVHPGFVRESCEEIEKAARSGIRLIGELVPYLDGWAESYDSKALSEILDVAADYNMVISFHPAGREAINRMVEEHPNLTFVCAHPGEMNEFHSNMESLQRYENFYLDLSANGITRYAMLPILLNKFGADRLLYGSDFPVCNPSAFLGGILLDSLVKDADKEKILSKNAKRLLLNRA